MRRRFFSVSSELINLKVVTLQFPGLPDRGALRQLPYLHYHLMMFMQVVEIHPETHVNNIRPWINVEPGLIFCFREYVYRQRQPIGPNVHERCEPLDSNENHNVQNISSVLLLLLLHAIIRLSNKKASYLRYAITNDLLISDRSDQLAGMNIPSLMDFHQLKGHSATLFGNKFYIKQDQEHSSYAVSHAHTQ